MPLPTWQPILAVDQIRGVSLSNRPVSANGCLNGKIFRPCCLKSYWLSYYRLSIKIPIVGIWSNEYLDFSLLQLFHQKITLSKKFVTGYVRKLVLVIFTGQKKTHKRGHIHIMLAMTFVKTSDLIVPFSDQRPH